MQPAAFALRSKKLAVFAQRLDAADTGRLPHAVVPESDFTLTTTEELGEEFLGVLHLRLGLVHSFPADLVVECTAVGVGQNLVGLGDLLELGLGLGGGVLVGVPLRRVSSTRV